MNDTLNVPRVAYFSMEFGLHEDFAIYAGGLGILAGDVLRAARQLGVPLVGVGLLWQQGYTDQLIDAAGRPYDQFYDHHYDFLQNTGVQVQVHVDGRPVPCRVWKVDCFDNAPLYLLDTNLPGTDNGWMTRRLYNQMGLERVAQEIVLGVGGVRALHALGIDVDVYHFNEGHAALGGVELIREKIAQGQPFAAAWQATRQQIVFTTHTPVKEGNEEHPHSLLRRAGAYDGLTYEQMRQIGGDPFNMTVAGLRLSRMANGVSRLHGETARQMWKDIRGASPILAITNGVHTAYWQDASIREAMAAAPAPVAEPGADPLWQAHLALKKQLLAEVQARTGARLNPDALLIGFARRAALYKRGDLILRDLGDLEPLLSKGTVQFVFSGKAHPQDQAGKDLVARIVAASRRYPRSIVFLPNYDMAIGRLLTRGCDVWLNNPVRPLEASGTSGMKAAMNGVLNLSILDGWWPEACQHGVNGWQFGGGYQGPDQDQHDLEALRQTLLEEVIPTYYEDRPRWLQMMRSSITSTQEAFSAVRMLREYYARMYDPGATAAGGQEAAAGRQ